MPKNTPVNSSQSTPDSRTKGPHTDRPNCLPPRFRFSVVCFTCDAARVTWSAMLEPDDWLLGADLGPACGVVDGLADGLGEVAASTAVTSVFAAALAPNPNARPKRTESIS